MILHLPHTSVTIPESIRSTILLDDSELQKELLVMTDWYTDEIFRADDQSSASVIFPYSRLVADPERFTDDSDEPMAKNGMGAIYIRTSGGNTLRAAPLNQDRTVLMEAYYWPHHKRLTEAVENELVILGKCLIVDCHSFSSTPLPYEPDQDVNRPDICIGTDEFHTIPALAECAMQAFQSHGHTVAVNRPYSGTIVPAAYYYKDKRVLSIMIELNRGLYLDESTGKKTDTFDKLKCDISAVLGKLQTIFMDPEMIDNLI